MATEYDERALGLALQDLDGNASTILLKLKNTPQNDIVVEMYSKICVELLAKTRTSLFDDAVGLYDEQLADKGLSGKASISLVDRRGDKRPENLAKDIVKLVNFNSHLKNEFPREIISSKSVYVDIDQPSSSPIQSEETSDTQRPKSSDGKELSDEQMIDCMWSSHVKTNVSVKRLWEYVYNLEKIVQMNTENAKPETQQTINPNENKSESSPKEKKTEPESSDTSSDAIPNGQAQGPESSHSQAQKLKSKSDPDPDEKKQSRKKPLKSKDKKAKKKPASKSSKSDHVQSTFTQIMRESESESESSDSESESSAADTETETETDSDDSIKTYSEAASGENWQSVGRNGASRRNKGKDKKKEDKLSGITQEASVAMYVQNIKRKPEMSMGKIASLVKSHLKEKGVRCLSAQVIRNRFVDDTVGCKIIVPLRKKDTVMGIKIWPNNVKCREWAGDWDSSGASIARNFGESGNMNELQGRERAGPSRTRGPRRNYGYRPNPYYDSYWY